MNSNIKKRQLSISIDPEVNKILEDGAINKSKLINKLLKVYLEKRRLVNN